MSTAPESRSRQGRPGYDQATVLRRAVALFNRQGYDGTSVGDLARDLGLSKSAIYHHVASKEALLAAALDEALDALEDVVGDAVLAPGSAADRLEEVVRASVGVLVERQPAVTLLLRVRGNGPTERAALERRRHLDETLARLVADAIDEGSLAADRSPEVTSRLLFGLVNSLVEWYDVTGPLEPAALADAVTSMAFHGLRR